jgi:hypothetical protein
MKLKPNKVRAWMWGVLNPIIDGLARQAELLQEGNLTWRYRNQRPEYIYPIEQFLDKDSQDNLRDLYRFPEGKLLRERSESHRQTLERANDLATAAWTSLVRDNAFREQVCESLSLFGEAYPDQTWQRMFATKDDAVNVAGERLVNDSEHLPAYYVDAPFWNTRYADFSRWQGTQPIQALRAKVAELHGLVLHLIDLLHDQRLKWSDDFDIPVAPYRDVPA